MTPSLAASLARGFAAANRLRLALTVGCIALGVALAGAVHTVHTSALAEVDRAARALSGAADLEVRGPRSGFDDALFARIASLPGVAVASPIVEVHAGLGRGDDSLRVMGVDAFRAVRLQPAFIASAAATGSGSAASILDEHAVWLSPAAAAKLDARVDGTVTLVAGTAPREYRVAGLLSGLADGGAVAVMDIAAAQAHFGRVGLLSRIEIRLASAADAARVRDALAALLPPGVIVAGAASAAGRAAAISRGYRVNLDALALVALATGAFLVFSTLALQAARRRQEFALLRALGVTRRGLTVLVVLEGAVIGAAGAVVGTALGLAASRAFLRRSGGDLGAGFFEQTVGVFTPDAAALAGIAMLGIAVAIAGSLWVARSVARMEVATALRDRAVDLPLPARGQAALAAGLALAGLPLLALPPVQGLPLAGYGAIALWIAAAVVAVAPLCRALLARIAPARAVSALAVAQLRDLPGHLAASVAGIVVSASLCAAMVIMVHSFRESLDRWLHGVVRADLYVRAAPGGDSGYFTADEQRRIASLPGIARIEVQRYDRLAIGDAVMPLTLVARPIDAAVLAGFGAQPAVMPAPGDAIPVWISEAARDLHGWQAGDRVELPVGGRAVGVRVAGVVRDYARIWGAVLMRIEDHRRLTGDERVHGLDVHLDPAADAAAVQSAIRAALGGSTAIAIEDAAGVRRRSLEIFDRSFAVTYALEAIAIAIGLAGVTSSFAALAWSRRREFGVLRFLGLTRGEVLGMLSLEGALAGALGAAVGLATGAAISMVLVHVVNRQSFHWGMEVHWPLAALAILAFAIVAACAAGARVSGAMAVRHEAVAAVKDDA